MYKINFETLRYFYLFEDGHAVARHATFDHDYELTDEWVDIYQCFSPSLKCNFSGRIVFGPSITGEPDMTGLLGRCTEITVLEPSIDHSLPAAQRLGVPVGFVQLKGQDFSVTVPWVPLLTSIGFAYDQDSEETWEDIAGAEYWNDEWRIRRSYLAKVHRKPVPITLPNL